MEKDYFKFLFIPLSHGAQAIVPDEDKIRRNQTACPVTYCQWQVAVNKGSF